MARTFAFGAAVAQGGWPVQEDGYFADPIRGCFAIADGFGGRGAGDMAAKLALAEVAKAQAPAALFAAAHQAIQARNQSRPPAGRGGASLLLAQVHGSRLELHHTGACLAGLLRGGQWRPLVVPQAEPRQSYQAQLADEALGLAGPLVLEKRSVDLLSGDLVVLVSSGIDGLSQRFAEELVAQANLRLPGQALTPLAEALVGSAQGGEAWNRSALLLEKL